MSLLNIPIKNTSGLPLPEYQSDGSAGFDFLAAITEPILIKANEQVVIPTGIHIALPAGCELQVRGRSGLAAKYGIGLTNGVGTIDSDYRGEIQIILRNFSNKTFEVNRGDRIAQGVIAKYEQASWQPTNTLDETKRGAGGLGSTGHHG